MSDAWAWLIVRDVFLGVRRFDDLCTDLGISRKVLAARLKQLTTAGVLARDDGTDAPTERSGYRLTDKGAELVPILAVIVEWGDRWEPTAGGPPIVLRHTVCGAAGVDVTCAECGESVAAATLRAEPGPGGSAGIGTALIGRQLASGSAPDDGAR